ncbi:ATP-dependent RNA helicase DOB1 [Monoraphidium neglectum]|uniref:ATP-dependent RNA helicase DOB1 n=1 Tax=Monoraphidium neglectum TaxID=145388 RepID=A0A0D2MXK6_9CHLO|nr:ATP-dependent RNA helicase DOB1 [Monoraphidium neglectum]KIY98950.1 ATP-dependent RNA helicase DOB1 [Monoraphidium neglectum]|eukprot:XP_013897970.1 ATP-dependent RNA helicase DOB1 [Monoraphidium neglectum]
MPAGHVEDLLTLLEQRAALSEDLRAATTAAPDTALRFLQPGRLVKVAAGPPDPRRPLPQLGPVPKGASLEDAAGGGDAAAGGAAGGGSGVGGSGSDDETGDAEGAGHEVVSLGDVLRRVDGASWGVLISFEKAGKHKQPGGGGGAAAGELGEDGDGSSFRGSGGGAQARGPRFVVDVLVSCDPSTLPRGQQGGQQGGRALPRLTAPGAAGSSAQVVTFPLEHLAALSSVRIRGLQDLRTQQARDSLIGSAAEALRRQPGGEPPQLDPQSDMKAGGKEVKGLVRRLESLDDRIARHPLAASPALARLLGALQAKRALAAAAKVARREAKAAAGLVLSEELKARQRLLRRLGYVDDDGLITAKGRVAADLQSGDELVLTELIFSGAFSSLTTEQLVATASCFVWQEKREGGVRLPKELQGPLKALQDTARRVGKAAADSKVALDPQEYADSFRPELMNAAAAWARGQRFAEVIKMAEVFEGSLVRAVRRLEELLRQVSGALRSVGDSELAAKFDEARTVIKRDVIFAASLYL